MWNKAVKIIRKIPGQRWWGESLAGCESGAVDEREQPSPPPQSLKHCQKMPLARLTISTAIFADEKHLLHRAGEALKH